MKFGLLAMTSYTLAGGYEYFRGFSFLCFQGGRKIIWK
jgi:hypothetical protein